MSSRSATYNYIYYSEYDDAQWTILIKYLY
jgi:hypothetical protein